MTKKLYIITINYNSSIHTIELIDNLSNSSFKNFEVVIVDNNSNIIEKEKLKVIKKQAHIIYSENNLGFSGGNNLGIKYALDNNADYVMILNNDTIIDSKCLKNMMEYIVSTDCDAICPLILNYYNRDIINYAGGELVDYKGAIKIYGLGKKISDEYLKTKKVSFAHGCCILMKANLWKEIGFMNDKYFLYFEDTDLSSKIRKMKKNLIYFPQSIVYHKESISTHKFSDNYQYYFCRNRLLYIKENINFPIKILAYFYSLLYIIKAFIKHDFNLQNILSAIKDFLHHKYGKRKEE